MGIRDFPVISIGAKTGARVLIDGSVLINLSAVTTEGGSTPKFVLVVVTPGTAERNVILVQPCRSANSAHPSTSFPMNADRPQFMVFNTHGLFRIGFVPKAGSDDTSYGYVIPLEDF